MSDDNPHTRTFRRAIDALGGIEELARALGVTVAEIDSWLRGRVAPPPGIFLKAIDIVAQGPWNGNGRRPLKS